MNPSTRSTLLLLLLLAVTLAVYLPVSHHEFVNYDDDEYVTENRQVTAGLTWEGVRWAFTTGHAANWHPVTWLSHMTDCQLFGVKPGAHHRVNVGFHLLNVALLFWVLRLMTGAVWRSLVVAGLFALHPLHVESVAWIAERKDVLSTMFGLLTIWAYTCYVRRPGVSRYALALLFFTLGLMSKPMLVTWPFVLLLLDWWPLGRWGRGGAESRIQNSESRRGYSASSWDGHLARPERCAGCHKATGGTPVPRPAGLFSAVGGTGHRISSRASRLRVKYSSSPRPERSRRSWLLLEKAPFFLLAIASSVVTFLVQQHGGAVIEMTQWPLGIRVGNALIAYGAYLMKMLWPVNLAVLYPMPPTVSVVQVIFAIQLLFGITLVVLWRARRQPYLAVGWFWYLGTLVPVIGLVQVGVARMADRYTYIPLIGIFVLGVWAVADLAGRWRWARVVAGTAAVAMLVVCGAVTMRQIRVWENSRTLLEHALSAGEASTSAHNNLGNALVIQGQLTEAIAQYQEALRLQPDHANAHNNLGIALAKLGQFAEAIAHYQEALRLQPDDTDVYNNLGHALASQARLLATSPAEGDRNGAEAVKLAERACTMTGRDSPGLLDTLAAAYAEAGRFAEAVKTAEKALVLAQGGGNKELAAQIETHLQRYRQGQPWREK